MYQIRTWMIDSAGSRNCINLHLFIDINNDCCNHKIPLVHLKQVNTKKFTYNCNTALKHKNAETGLTCTTLFIQYPPRKQQSVISTKISNILPRNCKRVHIMVYWIMFVNIRPFDVISKTRFQNSRSVPGYTTHFTNNHFP